MKFAIFGGFLRSSFLLTFANDIKLRFHSTSPLTRELTLEFLVVSCVNIIVLRLLVNKVKNVYFGVSISASKWTIRIQATLETTLNVYLNHIRV